MRILFLVAALFYAATSAAITADELRGASDDSDREKVQRQNRANTDELDTLLPGDAPRSTKYGTPGTAPAKQRATKKRDTAASPAASGTSGTSGNYYTPPPRSVSGTSSEITSDAVKVTVAFGIRLGSWLDASLDRNTTSAETGTVEITLQKDYVGDRRTLPAGTVFFAEKSLNGQTKRMEMVVTHGITPTGLEFDMRGLVFDPQKIPGLAGVYVMDKKEVASQGIQKGALAGIGAAVTAAAPGPVGAATNAATQNVLNNVGQVSDNNAPQAVIYVSPQALIIRVEKQF
jgi:hypothetical protein